MLLVLKNLSSVSVPSRFSGPAAGAGPEPPGSRTAAGAPHAGSLPGEGAEPHGQRGRLFPPCLAVNSPCEPPGRASCGAGLVPGAGERSLGSAVLPLGINPAAAARVGSENAFMD